MQVSVENVSNVERRLTIIVPADLVEEAYAQQINRFAKKANIKGFRPGKAPLSYIQQHFGEDARKEALSEVIQKSVQDALEEKKLNPVSQPQIQPKTITPNEPLEFTVSFEVLPEIGTVKFSMDKVEKLLVDVKEEDIQHVITQLRKQRTKWNVVDRAAEENDRIVIDYYTVFEGQSDEANKVQNTSVDLGGKNMLPGFEVGLIGVKAGDTRTLHLTFPADFADAARAGKPIEFIVTVKQVFSGETPEWNEAFIKALGVKSGSEEDLKTQIKQSLEQERDRIVKEKLKEQVFKQILDQNPLEVPNSLIAREAKLIHDEVYPHQHDHAHHTADEMTTFNDIAKKRVILGLLINEYAKQMQLKANQDKVKERIQQIASVYENPKEVIAYLSSDERLAGIEFQVLEDQLLDKLLEGVVEVNEKTVSFADLKGIRT